MVSSSSVVPSDTPSASTHATSVVKSSAAEAGPCMECNQVNQARRQNQQSSEQSVRDKYVPGKLLGEGTFGQVIEVTLRANPGRARACKMIERRHQDELEDDGSSTIFPKEVSLLQTLKHPNIVRLWDFHADQHFFYVVMDLCLGGELYWMIQELERITEADAAILGAQMLAAIDYIHKMEIMHRDIKAENCLLAGKSPTSVVKLVDFGMATKFKPGEEFCELVGSPHYFAPEMIRKRYNHMVDIWSFGVLMYVMMYGEYPFHADSFRGIVKEIKTGEVKWITTWRLSEKPQRFLQRVLQAKPEKRITAETALLDGWILMAGSPDPELDREPTEQNLTEVARSAQKQISSARHQADLMTVELGPAKLPEVAKESQKEIRHGEQLGNMPKEDLVSKAEFVRRTNRFATSPEHQFRKTLKAMKKSLAALATSKMQALRMSCRGGTEKASSHVKFDGVMTAVEEQPQVIMSGSDLGGEDRLERPSKVRQACSMRESMLHIGELHPPEISSLRETWEHQKQQADQQVAESAPARHEDPIVKASIKMRNSAEECGPSMQAGIELAGAKQNFQEVALPGVPSSANKIFQLIVDAPELPLQLDLPPCLLHSNHESGTASTSTGTGSTSSSEARGSKNIQKNLIEFLEAVQEVPQIGIQQDKPVQSGKTSFGANLRKADAKSEKKG